MNDMSQVPVATLAIGLTEFIDEFGDELLDSLNHSNPPVYASNANEARQRVMNALKRQPFPAQAEVVQAVAALLLDRNEQAAVINAEMGTGMGHRSTHDGAHAGPGHTHGHGPGQG